MTEEKLLQLEASLNDFKGEMRQQALAELKKNFNQSGNEEVGATHNLHCHTFYSYNGYGYSPSYIAWWALQNCWFAAGIVDFDVLDAVDEFLAAAQQLNVRGVCGLETRAFMPEFSHAVLNSPGEPGIAYHMGVGFTTGEVPAAAAAFLKDMRAKANARTQNIVAAVNGFLAPVTLDYDKDVVPLTPAGNATERHVCAAYFRKAETVFSDESDRVRFWAEKLSTPAEKLTEIVNDRVQLEALIRSKTMKSGGPGYVKPVPEAFPLLKDMNLFVRQCGAIPTIAWLDGASDGEKDVDKLLDAHIENGAAALNIIPDRNWNFKDPAVAEKKIFELNRIIAAAQKRDLPIIVGTEMNAPGQKLVDDFDCPALAPHLETFVDGAAIMFAHTLLQQINKGYLSAWSGAEFRSPRAKNEFFASFGRQATPAAIAALRTLPSDCSAKDLMNAAK